MDVDREVPKASSEQSPRKRPLSSSDLASRKRSARATVLKIVSATYGPSEGRRLILLWLRLLKSGEWDKAVEFFRRAFKFRGERESSCFGVILVLVCEIFTSFVNLSHLLSQDLFISRVIKEPSVVLTKHVVG